ncbi:MAG: RNA methyltransferase [Saprospiraceae bacterium]|nr:RNA methyltransferase [Saprospiraceae bacterium]
MKLHRLLIQHVIDALYRIFEENQYSDRVLEKLFKNNKILGARDRGFIAETVYDILRYYRLYHFVTEPKSDWWNMIVAYSLDKKIDLPEWPEFKSIDQDRIRQRFERAYKIRCLRESIPDWLDQIGMNELADQWEIELNYLNKIAQIVLRVNTLKISKEALKHKLNEINIDCYENESYKDALILKERRNVFNTELFKSGFFELQDASSQQVAEFCNLQSGMRIIDACAGAGGKSLHSATIMKNKGQVISLDTEGWKLQELRSRAKRNGIHIIETRTIDSSKVIKRLQYSGDRVLLDVPCSGLGVLRRNPDTKWKLNEEFLQRIRKTQSEILNSYHKMMKPDGKLIYCTCSILPSENQNQIENFIRNNSQWNLEDERTILPSTSGFDGFYMARLSLKND